jgi:hypothetical protein
MSFKCRLELTESKGTQNIAKKKKKEKEHKVLCTSCCYELEQSKGTIMSKGAQILQKI